MKKYCLDITRRQVLERGFATFGCLGALGRPSIGLAQPAEGFICASVMPYGATLDPQSADDTAKLEVGEAPVNTAVLSPQGVAYSRRRWRPQDGLTAPTGHIRLGVAFIDTPDGSWKDEVIKRARRWVDPSHPLGAKLARRLSFDFSVNEADAQIIIGRGGTGPRKRQNASFIGTDCLTRRVREDNRSTMVITDMRSVEHEFGHALCLGHEHNHKELPVEIDPERAINYYFREYGWDAETTIANVLTDAPSCLGDELFNPASVMLYSISAEITADGTSLARFNAIHERDRACLNRIYGAS